MNAKKDVPFFVAATESCLQSGSQTRNCHPATACPSLIAQRIPHALQADGRRPMAETGELLVLNTTTCLPSDISIHNPHPTPSPTTG